MCWGLRREQEIGRPSIWALCRQHGAVHILKLPMARFRDMDLMCSIPLTWNVRARKFRCQKDSSFPFQTQQDSVTILFVFPRNVTSLSYWWKSVSLHRLKSFFIFTEMQVILNARWTGSPWKCSCFLSPIYSFIKHFLISCQVSSILHLSVVDRD